MGKVVPANDAQAFLDALETSQILSADALAKVRARFESATDVKTVARELIKDGLVTKWQAGQLLHKFTALIVGNYKLLDQLGVGEMGRVYLAEHVQMQRKVALKVLARKHTSQPQVLRRLLAEARRVAAIEHPNISHIQDVNQDGERYFIVLEYVDGDDLQRVVQRDGKLSATKSWNYLRQTAEGLTHAHAKGVVHGGLKPSNLLVDKLGNIKILDFGLAQLASGMEGSGGDSVEQAAIMARLYRAPEADKQPGTQLADVYSLGASLYYMLTGKDPAQGPASAGQLTVLAPETPAQLLELCGKLMSADPASRPQSDKELIAAIDAARPSNRPAPPPPKAPAAATKSAAIPIAKALPGNAAPVPPAAKEPPPKAKKPPMAKALPLPPEPTPEVATPPPEAVASEAPVETPASDTPFAGFAVQTKKSKSPPAKAASGIMPAVAAAAHPPAVAADPNQPVPAKSAKGKGKGKASGNANLPLIIAGGVGGGVLVLGVIIGLIIFLTSGKDDKQEIAKAFGENTATAVDTGEPAGEANPPTEANPAPAGEANPVVAPTPPVPNPIPMPMPAVPPMPDPAKPDPAPPVEPKPADPPMVATVTPEPPKPPEPKPMPKPMPKPVAVGNPFEGFAKSVALPKVVSGVTEAPPEMLVPIVLGPCKVPDENTIISSLLKGGETAYSKGKMKFTLESANGGTSLRDWEFKVAGGLSETPVIIATMSAKNDQLTFQWTPEAAKHPAGPYLCNCLVELKAGNGKAEFALRQPVSVDPIVIGIEKRPPPTRLNIDLPPEHKQLMFEIVSIEGEVPKVKYDNKDLVADKDTTFIWVGNVETEMPLGLKVETSITNSGRTVQVTTLPHFKLEGMPKALVYGKKDLGTAKDYIDGELRTGNAMIQQASVVKDAKAKQDLNQAGTLKLEPAQKLSGQFEQMLALAKGLQTNGKLHFRIYASAEDGKVELINSQGAGAAPAPMVPAPAIKAPANAGAGAPANGGGLANAGANPPAKQAGRQGPGPKQPVGRPPLGVIETTAEELGLEALETTTAAFDEKYKGKQFRITGAVESVDGATVNLKVEATKGLASAKVVLDFTKAADAKGLRTGAQIVVDGDFQSRATLGPSFSNCEIVSQ